MVDKDPKLNTWCKGIIVPSGLETVEKFPKISPRNFVFRISYLEKICSRWARHSAEQLLWSQGKEYDPAARPSYVQNFDGDRLYWSLHSWLGSRSFHILCAVHPYLNCFFQSTAIRREKKGGIIALADWWLRESNIKHTQWWLRLQ